MIWRRRKGSLGSVSEAFLLRLGSGHALCMRGGGRRDDSRIGGSTSWVGSGQKALRTGDVDVGMVMSSNDEFLCSCWRSVDAKLRDKGLSGGVVSPVGAGRIIFFMQRSHMPDA